MNPRTLVRCSACLLTATLLAVGLSTAQVATEPAGCAAARQWMADEVTPHDLGFFSGSPLTPDRQVSAVLTPDEQTHYLIFRVDRMLEQSDIHLTFASVSRGARLEYALFFGMERLTGYAPVEANSAVTVTVTADGLYTLVIRRAREDGGGAATVSLTAEFPSERVSSPIPVRNISTGEDSPTQFLDGVQVVNTASAQIRTHPDALLSVGTPNGTTTEVRFSPDDGLIIGEWAQQIALLGGGFSARSPGRVTGGVQGIPYIVYVEDFGYHIDSVNAALSDITDSNGQRLVIDWASVRGVWLLRDCVGVKFADGRSVAVPRQYPGAITVSTGGGQVTLGSGGMVQTVTLDASGTVASVEVTGENGTLQTTFDAQGRITSVSENTSMLEVTYNVQGWQINGLNDAGLTAQMDAEGRLAALGLGRQTLVDVRYVTTADGLLGALLTTSDGITIDMQLDESGRIVTSAADVYGARLLITNQYGTNGGVTQQEVLSLPQDTFGLGAVTDFLPMNVEVSEYTVWLDENGFARSISADETCATFDYDERGRLISMQASGVLHTFTYDAYEALVTADDWRIARLGDSTVGVTDSSGAMTWFGGWASHPPFFAANSEGVTWLLSDGAGNLVGAARDGEVTPLIRQSLSPDDPCGGLGLSADVRLPYPLPAPEVAPDAVRYAGLVFSRGRVMLTALDEMQIGAAVVTSSISGELPLYPLGDSGQ